MCSRSSSPALHKPGCTSPKDESPRPQPRTGRFFCCNENRLTHASLLTQGVSQTAGTKGTSPSAKCSGNADVLATTASGSHLRQGDVKRKGADLLVAPLKLNVRLSKCGPRSVESLRRLVKRRNSSSWLRSRCRRRWALRSSPNRLNRLNRLSHRNRQS